MMARCLLVLVLIVGGCGTPEPVVGKSPADVVRAYRTALEADDRDACEALLHPLARRHSEPPLGAYFYRARLDGCRVTFDVQDTVIDGERAEVHHRFTVPYPMKLLRPGVFRLHRIVEPNGQLGDWKILHLEDAPNYVEPNTSRPALINLPRVSEGMEDTGDTHVHRLYVSADGATMLEDGRKLEATALGHWFSSLPPRPGAEGRGPIIRLHADQATPWLHIQDLLRVAAVHVDPIWGVGLAIRSRWPRSISRFFMVRLDRGLRATLPLPRAGEPRLSGTETVRLEVAYRSHGEASRRRTVVRLAGGAEVAFPRGSWPTSTSAWEWLKRTWEYERVADDLRETIEDYLRETEPRMNAVVGRERRWVGLVKIAKLSEPGLCYGDVVQAAGALMAAGAWDVMLLDVPHER